ncbi:NIPSNAP family protein [Roseibium salinum]|nr:NIPSNAP family protein [Roseibium salinum]
MKTQTIEREDFAPAGVIELRRYRLQPGTRETLIKLFDREFIEPQEEAGMRVIAQFRDLDDPDCFVWLRGFEDMEKRRKALGTFYAGPVWARHKHEANGTMVNSDNVLLLRPASAQATLFPVRKTRPPRTAGGDRTGLVIATIAYLAPRKRGRFCRVFFRQSVEPLLAETGATVLAALVPERSENTFPRLPVREGETVFRLVVDLSRSGTICRPSGSLERIPNLD